MVNPERPISAPAIVSTFRALAEKHAAERVAADSVVHAARVAARRRSLAPRSSRPAWALRTLVALAAVSAVALIVFVYARSEPLRYQISGAQAGPDAIRTEGRPAYVSFSDGSEIEAGPQTTFYLDVVGERSARAQLVQGALRVSVEHSPGTDWRFVAGPYEIRVVGTRFALEWQPAGEALTLAMHEGEVTVIGPQGLRAAVRAGERISWSAAEASTSAVVVGGDATDTAQPQLLPRADKPSTTAPSAATSPAPAAPRQAPALTWSQLVAQGEFAQVVAAAREHGEERVLRSKGASDLNALAQAAHYSSETQLAIASWEAVRSRGMGPASSAQAAFFLARVHEQSGEKWEALRWLETYLAEAPTGVYASEALGRQLTLARQLKSLAATRRIAREYLERFPAGPYAGVARDTLSSD